MRPMYESNADRLAEENARQKLAEVWKCEMYKLPMRYHCDFVAQRDGKIVGLIEYKRNPGWYTEVLIYVKRELKI